ncbi:hypothetical protein K438DRAFT_1781084 [Mycena galopus ATCC 62051]|nr:hypothetical protein K438DRAFT_1781084 [Mycena galopus ATCC 62051]
MNLVKPGPCNYSLNRTKLGGCKGRGEIQKLKKKPHRFGWGWFSPSGLNMLEDLRGEFNSTYVCPNPMQTNWRIYKTAVPDKARLLCMTNHGFSSSCHHHPPSPNTLNASLTPFIPGLQVGPNVEDLESISELNFQSRSYAPAIWYNVPVGTGVSWLEKIEAKKGPERPQVRKATMRDEISARSLVRFWLGAKFVKTQRLAREPHVAIAFRIIQSASHHPHLPHIKFYLGPPFRRSLTNHGFCLWDEFFAREIQASPRPMHFSHDTATDAGIIVSACEASVFCMISSGSKARITYSLYDTLNRDNAFSAAFVSGTAYQGPSAPPTTTSQNRTGVLPRDLDGGSLDVRANGGGGTEGEEECSARDVPLWRINTHSVLWPGCEIMFHNDIVGQETGDVKIGIHIKVLSALTHVG